MITRRRVVLVAATSVALVAGGLTPATAGHSEIDDSGGLVTSVRWAGVSRDDTAAKVAVEAAPAAVSSPADAAIIATNVDFPDALAGSYLSGIVGGPILLTSPQALSPATRTRLTASDGTGLNVDTVYVLGGTKAVGRAVERELEGLVDTVVRVAGDNRIDTAARIAEFRGGVVGRIDGRRTALLSRADEFADALVAGVSSRAGSLPLLLTDSQSLPQRTVDALRRLGIEHVVIAGGDAAVSPGVERRLRALGLTTERVRGGTRTGTAADFGRFNREELGFSDTRIGLTRGDFFADGLALGPYAGRERFSVVLSATPRVLSAETAGYLGTLAGCTFSTLYVAGGTGAVSEAVEQQARAALTTGADCSAVDRQAPGLARAYVAGLGTGGAPDRLRVDFGEAVACTGEAPEQIRYVAAGGARVAATALTCPGGATVDVEFPGGTVATNAGAVEHLQAAAPDRRLRDGAGNQAASPHSVPLGGLALAVDATDDTVDVAPGDGACSDGTADGAECSLRAAIQEANAHAGPDLITLAPGTYTLSLPGRGEDAAASGDLDVTDDLELRGAATVDAAGIDRVFDLHAATTLADVTLTGGHATDDDAGATGPGGSDESGADGGGVRVAGAGQAVLENVTVTGNAADRDGGGVHLGAGDNAVDGGAITGNTAARAGGGVWNGPGALTLDGSTVADNVASGDDATTGGGGGIYSVGGTMALTDAVVSDNIADGANGSGGGIFSGGWLTTERVDVLRNEAVRAGGGIEIADLVADGRESVVSLRRSKIAGNDASTAGTTALVAPGHGGGVHSSDPEGRLTIVGGRLEENTAQQGGAVWHTGGVLWFRGSTEVLTNVAASDGGGIYTAGGKIRIEGARILDNTATTGQGGGIRGAANAEEMSVTSSLFTGNAAANGGAIWTDGQLTLSVTEFRENRADVAGGALFGAGADGGFVATAVLLADNVVNTAGADDGDGAGVYADDGTRSIFIESSLTSATDADETCLVVSGALDVSHSLDDDASCFPPVP